jgi:hypothetical protein
MDTVSGENPIDSIFSEIIVDYLDVLYKIGKYSDCLNEFLRYHSLFEKDISVSDYNKIFLLITKSILKMGVAERNRVIRSFFGNLPEEQYDVLFVNKILQGRKDTILLGVTPKGILALASCENSFCDYDNFSSDYMSMHTEPDSSLEKTFPSSASQSHIKRVTSDFFKLRRERSGSGILSVDILSPVSTSTESESSVAPTPRMISAKDLFPGRPAPPRRWSSVLSIPIMVV